MQVLRCVAVLGIMLGVSSFGCAKRAAPVEGPSDPGSDDAASEESIARGREIWLNATFGGEKFFAFLANNPDPARRIRIAFEEVVTTPRAERFAKWGVVNDPDCKKNPEGGADLCPDPNATGVIGIRKFGAQGGEVIYGVSCASCHAGFDPRNPPKDASEPAWANVHLTIGNPYLDSAAIFGHNLAPDDPRRLVLATWSKGTVDTTLLFDDHIQNPSVITQVWDIPLRPTFDVGMREPQNRSGRGGEDDQGLVIATQRVYTNIGVCFSECVAPRVAANEPIDLARCRADCKDFPPERDLEDIAAFLRSKRAPVFPGAPGDDAEYQRGREVFEAACGGCHVTNGDEPSALTNDALIPLSVIGTNACRSLTTKWDAGELWAPFSSSVYKSRPFKGYRTIPLTGVWATAPFLHDESVGEVPSATATPLERANAYVAAMRELMRDDRTPRVRVLPRAVGPFPAGTPLAYVVNRDPETGALLCDDYVEGKGHTFGATLAEADKTALIAWLLHQ